MLVAFAVSTLLGGPSVAAHAATGATSGTPQFTVVPSPPTGYNEPASLNAISTSGQAAWAVGAAGSPTSHPIIEHAVDGTWNLSTAAPSGANGGALTGVAAVSDTNVWAVGGGYDADFNQQPLVQHFDGTTWSTIPFAGAGDGTGILYDVTFTAPSDGWAVGYSGSDEIAAAAYHFDGSNWQASQLPPLPSQPILYAATASSATDVFAVGAAFAEQTQAVAVHYDGAAWATLPSLPAVAGATSTILTGADVVGTGRLWAVGLWQDAPGRLHPLAAFWNGSAWTVSTVPEVPSVEQNTLFRVRVAGPDDVWAVGSWRETDSTLNPYMLHFDGTQWTRVQLPDPGNSYAQLLDIGLLADGTILAIGGTNGPAALIEQASPAVAPQVTAPNVTAPNDPGRCAARLGFPGLTVTGQPAPTVTVNPPEGSLFPVGTTLVSVTATNSAGTVSTSFTVTVDDTQPPTITAPTDLTVNATSPTGAVVNYPSFTSSDNCPGVTVTSTLPSGSRLPIGVTTVTGTATDAAGNTANASFTVTVLSAAQQLTNLAAAVATVPKLGSGLSSQVAAIQSATTTAAKCQALADFVSHVTSQRGKTIPTVQANAFLAAARDIGGTLGC